VFCSVDGQTIATNRVGSQVFISLPDLGPGHHRLDAVLSYDPPVIENTENWRVKYEEADGFSLSRFSAVSSNLRIIIYDANGRQVADPNHFQFQPGHQEFRLTTPNGPSGIYFARIEDNSEISTVRLTRLR
jgi:hypothetical protein